MTDKEDTPSQVQPVIDIGTYGYGRTSRAFGQVNDEYNPKLRGRQALRMFREIADNSSIGGAYLKTVEAYVTQADRNLDPAKSGSPAALLCRDAIETMLDDLGTSFSGVLSDILSMCWAGFAYCEQTYKVRRGPDAPLAYMRSKHCDGLYGLADIQTRAQETITDWKWDEHGRVLGAVQSAPPEGRRVYLPLDGVSDHGAPVQCVHFKTKNARGNPEGASHFRNAYRDWIAIKALETFEAIGVERDMAGEPHQQVPVEVWNDAMANTSGNAATTIANLRKFTERMRRGEYSGLVTPGEYTAKGELSGYKFGLLQSGGRRPVDQDIVIKRRESRMAISFLGEGALLGMMGQGGTGPSASLASNKTGLLAMSVSAVMRSIAETINNVVIARIMQANGWPIDEAPVFSFGDLESDDMAALMPALAAAIGAGAVVTGPELDKYIRNSLGVPMETQLTDGLLQDRIGATMETAAVTPEPQELAPPVDGAEPVSEDELSAEEEDAVEEEIERGLTPEEAGAKVGVSPSVIRRAVATGQIPGAKFGRAVRIMPSDLTNYMRGPRK